MEKWKIVTNWTMGGTIVKVASEEILENVSKEEAEKIAFKLYSKSLNRNAVYKTEIALYKYDGDNLIPVSLIN